MERELGEAKMDEKKKYLDLIRLLTGGPEGSPKWKELRHKTVAEMKQVPCRTLPYRAAPCERRLV